MTSAPEIVRNVRRPKRNVGKSDDNDQAAKARELEERKERIDYTLDMVVHDLVSQGHLQPAKSYLLKTAEMREHIGRMCDQFNRRKKEEQSKTSKTRHVVPKSFSASNKTAVLKTSDNLLSTSKVISSPKKEAHSTTATGQPDYTDDTRKKLSSSRSANVLASSNQNRREVKKSDPWVTPRDIADDKPHRVPFVSKTEQHKEGPKIKKEMTTLPYSDSGTGGFQLHRNKTSAQAFRAQIDLSGFENDEISLDLDDRKLIITASRPKKGQQNARKVTEVIEIPEGVNLENLKIGRRLDGSLLIEEFVNASD